LLSNLYCYAFTVTFSKEIIVQNIALLPDSDHYTQALNIATETLRSTTPLQT